jgi:hypothetical protein
MSDLDQVNGHLVEADANGGSGFGGADLAKELLDSKPSDVEADKPFEYQVLRHSRADLSGFETSAELRARYVRYTDKMIAQVKELADPDAEPGPDGLRDTGVTMVFLDKSARPTYWMMDELWDLYAPGYRRPEVKFANIDRLDWQDRTGRIDLDDGGNNVDVSRLDEGVFRRLADTYRDTAKLDPEHPSKSVFAGRHIMVVDETRTTGTTLEIARQLFEHTFANSGDETHALDVTPYHWMIRPSGSQKTSEVPVWYNEKLAQGRGVNDRDIEYSQRDPEHRSGSVQHRGAEFLSTGPRPKEGNFGGSDSMSMAIRREIHQIREDMLAGRMRFSVQEHEDDDIAPELLAAVEPWREQQRALNARKRP